jgi:hypothetical protein
VRLSLDAVLDDQASLRSFLEGGGAFSLGIIPTNLDASFSVEELVDAVETSVHGALPRALADRVLTHSLLTPACGLALRSVVDAERVMEQLKDSQRRLARVTETVKVSA